MWYGWKYCGRTNLFDILENSNDLIDKQIGLFEEAGQLIGEGFYTQQIAHSQQQINFLEEEKAYDPHYDLQQKR